MPLSLSFILIGFFIWIAENIATFFGAWQYPNQRDGWSLVHLGKVSSCVLLVIVRWKCQMHSIKDLLFNVTI
jgi:uncharacterized membrane protein YoaT (DUF817 family)